MCEVRKATTVGRRRDPLGGVSPVVLRSHLVAGRVVVVVSSMLGGGERAAARMWASGSAACPHGGEGVCPRVAASGIRFVVGRPITARFCVIVCGGSRRLTARWARAFVY